MTTISAALLLFLILDPLGNLPVFLSLLKPLPTARRRIVPYRLVLRQREYRWCGARYPRIACDPGDESRRSADRRIGRGRTEGGWHAATPCATTPRRDAATIIFGTTEVTGPCTKVGQLARRGWATLNEAASRSA